ncbi:MAG: flavin reductase, partial [Clostridia bacterium]|nr:flavin reductase [Clostridia bacterium]
MRKNFGAKTVLYPMPVLIIGTYCNDGTPDAMNAAWGGISEENEISICISDDHKTAENVIARKAFTVSIADKENVTACDYVGIVSGNNEPDKIKKTRWTVIKIEFVDAPLFAQLSLALECRMKSYDKDT